MQATPRTPTISKRQIFRRLVGNAAYEGDAEIGGTFHLRKFEGSSFLFSVTSIQTSRIKRWPRRRLGSFLAVQRSIGSQHHVL